MKRTTVVTTPSRLEKLALIEAGLDSVIQAIGRLGVEDRNMPELRRHLGCVRQRLSAVVEREHARQRPAAGRQ
jgi:hypothetical protein